MSTLPTPPPSDPLPLVKQWLESAAASSRKNPTAMALATSDRGGRPAVRMVLLKDISISDGYAVFYTHYRSRKGRELASNARAAAVLYWEDFGRQVRFGGPVVQSPAAESDAYFATRPWRSQISAWSSEQSQPLGDPAELARRADRKARELGIDPQRGPSERSSVPRPEFWGGYRLWFETVELWVEGADRFHERLHYWRALEPHDQFAFRASAWQVERLQP